MSRRTTLRVGGPADVFVEPASEQDLSQVVSFCSTEEIPFFILGRGSNLLVRDNGIRGIVICLSNPFFCGVRAEGATISAGAGARLKAVAIEARRSGLTNMEFFEGIPGTVGGALRMNAGAMGSWTFNVVSNVRVMNRAGEIRSLPVSQIPVNYRSCPLLHTEIALAADFVGRPDVSEAIEQRMRVFSNKRWTSQPAAPSAGCMFKNPSTIPAGKLVDELGLKGTKVGAARVSLEHGNFIVNDGGATAGDVLALVEVIRSRARKERGIELETEVEIIGE